MSATKQHLHRIQIDAVIKKLDDKVSHAVEPYGLAGKGKGIKILIVDSGVPDHPAIPKTVGEGCSANFTVSPTDRDFVGHATAIAGIIGADNDMMQGLASEAELYYAKAVDDHSEAKFDAVIASVLWGIIKSVNIILISATSNVDNSQLHEAIVKANEANICVIAPMGLDGEGKYPASYPQVLSVGMIDGVGKVNLPANGIISTYISQSYAKISGITCATATAAGLCAVALENRIKSKLRARPEDVYDTVQKLIRAKAG